MKASIKAGMAIMLALFSINSNAEVQGPYSYVAIGGVNMHCTNNYGQRAAIFIDPSVNQYIGRASYNGVPIIQLGPGFFNRVPASVGQFWFLHECAHHVVGSNESSADCFAIRNMRSLGLIWQPEQVRRLLRQVSRMAGTSRHLPGPLRAQNIYRCLSS